MSKLDESNKDPGIQVKYPFKWYWLRWLCHWAELWHGLTGVLTFGWLTHYSGLRMLRAEAKFMDYSWRVMTTAVAASAGWLPVDNT